MMLLVVWGRVGGIFSKKEKIYSILKIMIIFGHCIFHHKQSSKVVSKKEKLEVGRISSKWP